MKRLSYLVVVGLILALIAPSAFAKVNLRIAYNPEKIIIETFNKTHPDINAVSEDVAGDSYYEGIIAQVAAGTPPDVIWLDFSGAAQFYEKGALMPIDDFLARDGIKLEDHFDAVGTAVMKYDGKTYGLPIHYGAPLGLYYNKDLFDAAGVGYPSENWTWADWLAAAKKLTRDIDGDGRTDQFGFWALGWHGYWVPFVWQNGGEFLSPDGKKATGYLDSKESIEAIEFWADLTRKHRVSPAPGSLEGHLFKTGQVAMYVSGAWAQYGIRGLGSNNVDDGVKFRWGVAPLPKGKQRANVLYGAGYAIPRNAAHPNEAWEFIKHALSPEMDYYTARTGIATPALNETKAKFEELYAPFAKQLEYSRMVLGAKFPWWNPVSRKLDELMEAAILGDDVAKLAKETAQAIDTEIEEWIWANE